jgi:uncharacterized protein YrrD
MDEGLPIAYPLLEKGVPVLASGGEQVGTVHHVVAAQEQDIFHGVVITLSGSDRRFVPADDVASLHEHGVDLRIDAQTVAALEAPGGAAPVYSEDPSETKWSHWARKMTGRNDWNKQG